MPEKQYQGVHKWITQMEIADIHLNCTHVVDVTKICASLVQFSFNIACVHFERSKTENS